jgi:hypothetical protein
MVSARAVVERPDDFDILSATWIMSCNDENPIITYRGIAFRICCDEDRAKSLVRSRPELFRPGAPSNRVETWKEALLQGKQLPSWLREIEAQDLREEAVAQLGPSDVFRNQFRAGRDSPRCDLQVIDWGLQHIERLRKADSDAREEKVRRWTTIVIPALSLLIALLSIGATTYMQYETLQTQSVNSIYQVTIQPKQANYASLMSSLFSAFEAAIAPDPARMYTYIDEVEKSIYAVEPFLDERHREELWEEFQSFQSFCAALVQSEAGQHSADKNAADQDFVAFRSTFRQLLYRSLFER